MPALSPTSNNKNAVATMNTRNDEEQPSKESSGNKTVVAATASSSQAWLSTTDSETELMIHEKKIRMAAECVAKLSDGERNILEEEFRLFDKDCKGWITRDELSSVLRDLGIYKTAEAEEHGVDAMFSMFDHSKDNKIDKDEFLGMMAISMKLPMTEVELREAFDIFDSDSNGSIDSEELKDALSALGHKFLSEEECDELFLLADTNGDGKLQVEEMIALFVDSDLGHLPVQTITPTSLLKVEAL